MFVVAFGRGRCRLRVIALGHPFREHRHQEIGVDRFGNMVVHACREAVLHVMIHGQRSHGHNRQDGIALPPRLGRQRANPASGIEAVHHRHLYIHENHVVLVRPYVLDGILSVGRHVDHHAFADQQFAGKLPIDLVVLDQQNAQTG